MNEIDFMNEEQSLSAIGMYVKAEPVSVRIKDAQPMLRNGLKYFLGGKERWLFAYNEIAAWMENNEGRGLLCTGSVGLGKTLICAKILPLILHNQYNVVIKAYDAMKMNDNVDHIKNKRMVIIDDVGIEGTCIHYGNRRNCFAEIVDAYERSGAMLVMTTNLTMDQLQEKYGERTVDRLKAITKRVVFMGTSFRK